MKIKGKAGLRPYKISKFCLRSEAESTMFDLLQKCDFQHVFLSYNNEGFLSHHTIAEMMKSMGTYKYSKLDHQRFKSQKGSSTPRTTEYLHHVNKF
jgi:adenine-specific DNA-methyltransferase